MNHPTLAEPLAETPLAACAHAAREPLNELGRIYLDAGLPLALAFEAALADFRSFEVPCACEI